MRTFTAVLLLLFCGVAASARDDWPDFRGPWCDGRANAPGQTNLLGLPLHWSESENVKWKTPIPYRGWSSPVILNGQIWLTTATLDGHEFFAICVDQEKGTVLFNQKIFHHDNPESLGAAINFNCYASPSPVLEPGRVYVSFGSYGTACLDTTDFKVLPAFSRARVLAHPVGQSPDLNPGRHRPAIHGRVGQEHRQDSVEDRPHRPLE
jgi:hypothetical protein